MSDRILWLSGPAGAGKTAIVKTIAERSNDKGLYTISFFFFRGDSTRNTAQPLVPTLLYQLFQLFPPLLGAADEIFYTHPRILDASIAEQCKLISRLSPIIRQSLPAKTQILLLLDGLDECSDDGWRSQGDILCALESLVKEDDSLFQLLIASRPEAHIQMTFNQLISQTQSIFLDEQYRPEKDIQLFVTAEFNRIKASHPSARSLPGDWPAPSDIDMIVTKSSGQFMYAATVMRYLADASTVPSLSLERVKGIVPASNTSPFIHLDSVYAFILSRVDDTVAARDLLSMALLQRSPPGSLQRNRLITGGPSLQKLLYHYNSRYSQALLESCVSKLSAVVQLTAGGNLKFYHASLIDFLQDQARSGTYWIDVDAFRAEVVVALWDKPTIMLRTSRCISNYRFLPLTLVWQCFRPTA